MGTKESTRLEFGRVLLYCHRLPSCTGGSRASTYITERLDDETRDRITTALETYKEGKKVDKALVKAADKKQKAALKKTEKAAAKARTQNTGSSANSGQPQQPDVSPSNPLPAHLGEEKVEDKGWTEGPPKSISATIDDSMKAITPLTHSIEREVHRSPGITKPRPRPHPMENIFAEANSSGSHFSSARVEDVIDLTTTERVGPPHASTTHKASIPIPLACSVIDLTGDDNGTGDDALATTLYSAIDDDVSLSIFDDLRNSTQDLKSSMDSVQARARRTKRRAGGDDTSRSKPAKRLRH
ncbi:hypothetical protein HGRIS_014181 [Hohenbuehelia grisea]|uniref:Uncharacterized protein n=1 Tax=Hohenbuehelia grisea TaxID=104357 RepID=A0ABR3JSK4_9AGAR